MQSAGTSLIKTSVYIAIAVGLLAYLRAAGAEALVARAFEGNSYRMVFFASLFGGLAPFCSCEVVPFVAALLALGTPLAPVMAFWLSSPIMDPAMFAVTSGALGFDFALAKTISAVAFGLIGGYGVLLFEKAGIFKDPLRNQASGLQKSCCGSPFKGAPNWRIWRDRSDMKVFSTTAFENALFLLKWLSIAYVLEAMMKLYVPSEWISQILGEDGFGATIFAAFLGAPAYLNGFAAAPLIAGLIEHGMGQAPAMAFMLAGSVTSIPAILAVWALVKFRIVIAYLVFGFTAAVFAGLLWGQFHALFL